MTTLTYPHLTLYRTCMRRITVLLVGLHHRTHHVAEPLAAAPTASPRPSRLHALTMPLAAACTASPCLHWLILYLYVFFFLFSANSLLPSSHHALTAILTDGCVAVLPLWGLPRRNHRPR